MKYLCKSIFVNDKVTLEKLHCVLYLLFLKFVYWKQRKNVKAIVNSCTPYGLCKYCITHGVSLSGNFQLVSSKNKSWRNKKFSIKINQIVNLPFHPHVNLQTTSRQVVIFKSSNIFHQNFWWVSCLLNVTLRIFLTGYMFKQRDLVH